MKWLVHLMILVWPALALADAGHDHGAPAPVVSATLAPRIEAQSDAFELVAVLEGGALTLYLDRFATNEPVPNARIEIESGAHKIVAVPGPNRVYIAPADAFTAPGQYPLVFTVQAGDETDLLNATLHIPPPPDVSSHGHHWAEWLVWIASGVVLVLGLLWLLRRRFTSRAAVALLAAVFALAALVTASTITFAHEGEAHNNDQQGPGAAGGNGAGARRLADGGVFMPKPLQRELGILTAVAKLDALAQSIEMNGRVISDPNAGGRVQATQAGRIEPGPRGLPALGQRVKQGDVLAYVKPVANAIALGNQRAQLAEITAQLDLTEKKVKRLDALEGSVPRKEIEAARAELASLAEKKSAVGASLNNREALVAPASGVVSAAAAVAGQVVEARDVLFEIVDPQRLMVEALAYDPVMLADIAAASAALPQGVALPLAFVGGAQQLREQALPLIFRIKPPLPALAVGQPLKVVAQTRRTVKGVPVPLAALARNGGGDTIVWAHVGAEKFVARKVRVQALDGARAAVTEGIAEGDRIVTAGAAALAQVR